MFCVIRILFLLYSIVINSSSIQILYSYILCLIMLHERKLTHVIVIFVNVCFFFWNTPVISCMDASIEMSLTLQHKIAQLEEKIQYFQEQVVAADMDFKEVLKTKAYYENKGAIAEWQRDYNIAESALKDTQTNLNSEIRMRNILKSKLESGDYSMTSKSTTDKRKASELESGGYDMTSKATTSKRKATD